MSLITIDSADCNRCGACVQACPVALLRQEKGEVPVFADEDFANCIACGHCVAVCPTQALNHKELERADFLVVPENSTTPDALEALLLSRRSVREYKKAPVPRQQIEKLLELARRAPTASNSQKICWAVITQQERLEEIRKMTLEWIGTNPARSHYLEAAEKGRDVVFRNATTLIVAYGPEDYHLSETDSVIALTQLELLAVSMGIGTCWGGLITAASGQNAKLREVLGLSDMHKVGGTLMIGQPRQKHYLVPPRNKVQVAWL